MDDLDDEGESVWSNDSDKDWISSAERAFEQLQHMVEEKADEEEEEEVHDHDEEDSVSSMDSDEALAAMSLEAQELRK